MTIISTERALAILAVEDLSNTCKVVGCTASLLPKPATSAAIAEHLKTRPAWIERRLAKLAARGLVRVEAQP